MPLIRPVDLVRSETFTTILEKVRSYPTDRKYRIDACISLMYTKEVGEDLGDIVNTIAQAGFRRTRDGWKLYLPKIYMNILYVGFGILRARRLRCAFPVIKKRPQGSWYGMFVGFHSIEKLRLISMERYFIGGIVTEKYRLQHYMKIIYDRMQPKTIFEVKMYVKSGARLIRSNEKENLKPNQR